MQEDKGERRMTDMVNISLIRLLARREQLRLIAEYIETEREDIEKRIRRVKE